MQVITLLKFLHNVFQAFPPRLLVVERSTQLFIDSYKDPPVTAPVPAQHKEHGADFYRLTAHIGFHSFPNYFLKMCHVQRGDIPCPSEDFPTEGMIRIPSNGGQQPLCPHVEMAIKEYASRFRRGDRPRLVKYYTLYLSHLFHHSRILNIHLIPVKDAQRCGKRKR